ncbi:hypothetical protein PtrSN002B_005471 [Pyrenophora tritici-repentis]|uniref:Uncharacterized protein n=2 Tax=Pyrenophora tritici-repentis TaxID=45151 RepID=A0A2W1EKD8_9PLEO|nr:uncharacterized protein PTRG_04704 [Pyrenophora tritici-repentis Pt-1C-BFP]KAA8612527.1 hypothetical protein PtrV1_13096 [Pyrenophora tritici-repentis]EDU47611.1 predicted protein [Pyrenophora tritici-repentis Pt-1C-BFP]KAF7446937.1 hypothetical protein A1F99_083840 [Pyrenophora tritici-repentis]KAF7569219.1 hypothetical protein PtrM4_116340 [Pyrenophora tritici-repentis]KAG9382990.1 hypothetical protein A1F94_006911 [Pyrenophora tritici-repentis]
MNMKTIIALMGLISMVLSGAVPRDTPFDALDDMSDNDFNAMSTPCQQCSQIYKDCRVPCHYEYCKPICKEKACKSIVNGKDCSSLCLWYC